MYRISRDGHEPIIDVDQVEAIESVIRSSKPVATMLTSSAPIPCQAVTPRDGGELGSNRRRVLDIARVGAFKTPSAGAVDP